jgi:hypothetical protein
MRGAATGRQELLQLEKVQFPSRALEDDHTGSHKAVHDVLAGCVARSGPGWNYLRVTSWDKQQRASTECGLMETLGPMQAWSRVVCING